MAKAKGSSGSSFGAMTNVMGEFLFDQVAMTHRFSVQIDNSEYNLGSWSKVSGLSVKWSKHVYRPGHSNDDVIMPGNSDFEPIKLERAVCSDSKTVQKWLAETAKGRKVYSGCISILDFLGMTLIEFELAQFFPIAWNISDFSSKSAAPALETLQLAHTGFLDDHAQTGAWT